MSATTGDAYDEGWDDGYARAKLDAVKMLRDLAKEEPSRVLHDILGCIAEQMEERL